MKNRAGEMMLFRAVVVMALLIAGSLASWQTKKPNVLVIMGDDIGWYNTSIYNRGDMGYQTPTSTASAKKVGCSSVGMRNRADNVFVAEDIAVPFRMQCYNSPQLRLSPQDHETV